MNDCRARIVERIRTSGPITFAEFMELALYDPAVGYYARASRRTGRAGDFFTSVDVGPAFGGLLARQLDEMCGIVGDRPFDLVEAGAADGRLARDILDAAAREHPTLYRAVRLHLVEASAAARAAQPEVLGPHAAKLASASPALPPADHVTGVILANELLDALPTHGVVMTDEGLREVHVDEEDDRLVERLLEPSSPEIPSYFEAAGVRLRPGWRGEVNLRAISWVRTAARALRRGFLMLVDYGHEAAELYSATHAAGTLATFRRHARDLAGSSALVPPWLDQPGERDITSHVDLTSLTRAAEEEGLTTLGRMDQTYFLLGLGFPQLQGGSKDPPLRTNDTKDGSVPRARPLDVESLEGRLALKTLLLPGGLGSTHKVMIFGRGVGRPPLRGCSYKTRLT